MRPPASGRACAPARPSARALTMRLRERRRLAKPRASRGVELLFQPVALTLQPITLPLQPGPRVLASGQFLAQPGDLPTQGVPDLVRSRGPISHALVMPDL